MSKQGTNPARRKDRWIAEAPLAWRLMIGGWHPDRPPPTRFVVHAQDAEDAVTLFRRRGIQGVTVQGIERYPPLDKGAR